MATPNFQQQSINVNFPSSHSRVQFQFVAKDLDGTPVDVSSGYTAKVLWLPQNPTNFGGDDMTSDFSVSLGSDGTVKINNTQDMAVQLKSLSGSFMVALSNDSFTTNSIAAAGRYSASIV